MSCRPHSTNQGTGHHAGAAPPKAWFDSPENSSR
jgi:hypothetical protein